MCTLVALRRPGHDWPLILAANRDEMADRPWKGPGRHWPDRPRVRAGLDELAGGSWLGLNDEGVLAGMLNRPGSLGPDARLRSRGELVLEALDHADAETAAEALAELDGRSYRTFNMVIADANDAYWLRHAARDDGLIEVTPVPEGLSMFTSEDRNSPDSARVRRFLPQFEAAPPPDPERGDWAGWISLLAARDFDPAAGPREAMTIVSEGGFGTLSSTLIALPAGRRIGVAPVCLFCAGPPSQDGYQPVPP